MHHYSVYLSGAVWNALFQWSRCVCMVLIAQQSTGSKLQVSTCLFCSVLDQVALGRNMYMSPILWGFQRSRTLKSRTHTHTSRELPYSRGQRNQLKATGLLTLISYLIPSLLQFTLVVANRADGSILAWFCASGRILPPAGG